MTDKTATERLREGLTARGVEWWNDAGTWWKVGEKEYHAWQFDDERLCMSVCYLTPEQAIAATLGHAPKDNPRNYVDGRPKIPNMPIGADPDWVDWMAGLRHDEPATLREAVEQVAFDAITFGDLMGPNGNTCEGVDEGEVMSEGQIDAWVALVAATLGAGTCKCRVEESDDYYDTYTRYHMGCGYTMYGDAIDDPPKFCAGCGGRIEVAGDAR